MIKFAFAVTGILLLLAACSKENNLLMGHVQATVGTHTVVVTDCYRTKAPDPERVVEADGKEAWRYTPCKDSEVLIRGDQLTVNGKSYGTLNPADGVLVDHGVVSIQRLRSKHAVPAAAVNLARMAAERVGRTRVWRKASTGIRRCADWWNRNVASV